MPNKCHLCTKPASSADGKLVCMGAEAKVHAGTKVAPEWLKVCRTCALRPSSKVCRGMMHLKGTMATTQDGQDAAEPWVSALSKLLRSM